MLDLSSAPTLDLALLLGAMAGLERPHDVGWHRLPAVVPHPGRFDSLCPACRALIGGRAYPVRNPSAVQVDGLPVDVLLCGQCARCKTVTWGAVPVARG